MKVQRAYLVTASGVRRIIAAAANTYFEGTWKTAMEGEKIERLEPKYTRWQDVPSAWLGGSPYFTSPTLRPAPVELHTPSVHARGERPYAHSLEAERMLAGAVINRAILDLDDPEQRDDALHFLTAGVWNSHWADVLQLGEADKNTILGLLKNKGLAKAS